MINNILSNCSSFIADNSDELEGALVSALGVIGVCSKIRELSHLQSYDSLAKTRWVAGAILSICLLSKGAGVFVNKVRVSNDFFLHPEEVAERDRVAYIVEAEHDFNGALPLRSLGRNNLLQLGTKYKVVYQKVDSPEMISQDIRTILKKGGRLEVIWMRCHGNPFSIGLGAKRPLNAQSLENSGLKEVLAKLPVNGVFVLESCSTGKSDSGIAQEIAEASNHWKVFAPTQNIFESSTALEAVEPISVKFCTLSDFFIPGIRLLGKDITRVFLKSV